MRWRSIGITLTLWLGLVNERDAALQADDDDMNAENAAVVSLAIIMGLSGGLLLLLYMLLKVKSSAYIEVSHATEAATGIGAPSTRCIDSSGVGDAIPGFARTLRVCRRVCHGMAGAKGSHRRLGH